MNDTAQIIVAIATLVTSIGTVILGIVNRQSIRTVQMQTDGIMNVMKADAREGGRLADVAEAKVMHQDAAAIIAAAEPTKVEIVKIPPIKP